VNIFTYGSLMFEEVWQRVVGEKYRHTRARLYGYRRLKVRQEVYPAVVEASPEVYVEGRLYFDITETDVCRLDRFEGEYYRKETVKCRLAGGRACPAAVYVFKNAYRCRLTEEAWDPAEFAQTGLRVFLARYRGFNS
jgi:gamma-glutamylcyclotransferase (GGCT)/AIG2-like uncharacterized protein YtfP